MSLLLDITSRDSCGVLLLSFYGKLHRHIRITNVWFAILKMDDHILIAIVQVFFPMHSRGSYKLNEKISECRINGLEREDEIHVKRVFQAPKREIIAVWQ